MQKALDLLARRPHFRRQLEAKLRLRGFEETDVVGVCDHLEERGFLDDTECARGLATGSMRRKGYGPRRVRAELAKRGAPETAVEEAVAEAFDDGEMPLLRQSAERWLCRREWDRESLARHLERKGFSSGAIVSLLQELMAERLGREY